MARQTVVVAFGGNALIGPGEEGPYEAQMRRAYRACRPIVGLIRRGYNVVLVHGNGPQVGRALIRVEESITKLPPLPMDACVAQTQGSMAYQLEVALHNQLVAARLPRDVVSLVTQVLVDPEDEALARPTKPVGPFFSAYRAKALMKEKRWRMVEDAGRGWRKVVPSPRPAQVLNAWAVGRLLAADAIVVAAGGGGIPVYRTEGGRLLGLEAVIDKDYTASLLAREVRADFFVILTAVDCVYVNYGKENQRAVHRLAVSEARRQGEEGQFPPGSMGPKIEACIEFVAGGFGEALITSANHLVAAMRGHAGTRIVPDPPQPDLFPAPGGAPAARRERPKATRRHGGRS